MLTQVIKLRLAADDERRLRDGAAAAGMPVSRYLRQRLRRRPILPRLDRGAPAPGADPRTNEPGGDDPPEQLTKFIRIRLTPSDRDEIGAHAEAGGMTVAGYARRRLLGHTVIAATDAVVIRELRRLSGLVKLVHTESGGAYSEETAGALRDLRAAIQRVARDRRPVDQADD